MVVAFTFKFYVVFFFHKIADLTQTLARMLYLKPTDIYIHLNLELQGYFFNVFPGTKTVYDYMSTHGFIDGWNSKLKYFEIRVLSLHLDSTVKTFNTGSFGIVSKEGISNTELAATLKHSVEEILNLEQNILEVSVEYF